MTRKPISKMSHEYNLDFDRLLRDAEHNMINCKMPYSALFPPYYGTRLEKEVKDAKNKARLRGGGDSRGF